MTAVVVQEVKWNAVASRTSEQCERWSLFLRRAQKVGRAHVVPGSSTTLIGDNWSIDCEDADDAHWLHEWLIIRCGFAPSMLKVRAA